MTLPYGRQSVSDEDVAAVADVLRSDWLTTGPAVAAFQEHVAAAAGGAHAVSVTSGTAALHTAYAAAGVGVSRAAASWKPWPIARERCGRLLSTARPPLSAMEDQNISRQFDVAGRYKDLFELWQVSI